VERRPSSILNCHRAHQIDIDVGLAWTASLPQTGPVLPADLVGDPVQQLWQLVRRLWPNLMFLAAMIAFVWLIGIDLWADYRQRHAEFEPARDARIVEARCKTGLSVAAFCNIRAVVPSLPGTRVDLRYVLIGWRGGDNAPIALLRANGSEPPALRHITTTYGIEHLTARIASFAVLESIMLSFVLAPLVGFLRRRWL
jgi:hypothetical protein